MNKWLVGRLDEVEAPKDAEMVCIGRLPVSGGSLGMPWDAQGPSLWSIRGVKAMPKTSMKGPGAALGDLLPGLELIRRHQHNCGNVEKALYFVVFCCI